MATPAARITPANPTQRSTRSPRRRRHLGRAHPVRPPLVTGPAGGPQVGVHILTAVLARHDVIHMGGPPLTPRRLYLAHPAVPGQHPPPGPHPLARPARIPPGGGQSVALPSGQRHRLSSLRPVRISG